MDLKKITDKSTISSLEIKDDFFVVSASKSSKLSSLSDFGKNLVNKDFSQTNTGPVGDTGEKGMYGIRGEFGLPGDYGQKGLKGFKGSKGESGEKGQKGFDGQRGYVGSQGKSGESASNGQKGLKGLKGKKGLVGDDGSIGDKGHKGNRGFNGINKIGKPGDIGQPGKKIKGADGYKGYKGKPSTRKGRRGDRGEIGKPYYYSEIRRSFKTSENSAYYHGRMLSFLFSVNNSESVSITSNSVLMSYVRSSRFLVFELYSDTEKLVSNKYSNFYVELDFEPFFTYGSSPVITKIPSIYSKKLNHVGNLGFDWFKDNSNEYSIAFYSVFNSTNETQILKIKTIYSFSNLHLNKIVAGDYTNLRI
tara:strand:+ start:1272 stop:2357 length:1086 start_codon:yes stop_codon:yes gene_type:complete